MNKTFIALIGLAFTILVTAFVNMKTFLKQVKWFFISMMGGPNLGDHLGVIKKNLTKDSVSATLSSKSTICIVGHVN